MDNLLFETQTVKLEIHENALILNGFPDFNTAPALVEQFKHWLSTHSPEKLSFDVHRVQAHNSAILGILLGWLRLIEDQKLQIEQIDLPFQLRELVDLFDLTPVLSQFGKLRFLEPTPTH